MKTIQISDEIYEGIAAQHSDVSAFVETLAQKALKGENKGLTPRFDATRVKAGMKAFGAKLGGLTLNELQADCRMGRE